MVRFAGNKKESGEICVEDNNVDVTFAIAPDYRPVVVTNCIGLDVDTQE